jgi:hypothetical protein
MGSGKIVDMVTMTDEAWENAMANMSDEDLIVYAKNVLETIEHNAEMCSEIPPEIVEHFRGLLDKYQRSVRNEKFALQNVEIARGRSRRIADEILFFMNSDKKGH